MEDAARARMGDGMVRACTRDRREWRKSSLDVLVSDGCEVWEYPAPNGELWTRTGDPSSEICKGT